MSQLTLSVLDSAGTARTINTGNPNGAATGANSLPVVLATDQALPLPTGAATDASITTAAGVNHADQVAVLAKLAILPTGAAETDRSGTITAGGTAQVAMAANAARHYFELQNLDATTSLSYRKDGNAAVAGASGSFVLLPYGFYSGQSTGSVSVISTKTGHAFSAVEV